MSEDSMYKGLKSGLPKKLKKKELKKYKVPEDTRKMRAYRTYLPNMTQEQLNKRKIDPNMHTK